MSLPCRPLLIQKASPKDSSFAPVRRVYMMLLSLVSPHLGPNDIFDERKQLSHLAPSLAAVSEFLARPLSFSLTFSFFLFLSFSRCINTPTRCNVFFNTFNTLSCESLSDSRGAIFRIRADSTVQHVRRERDLLFTPRRDAESTEVCLVYFSWPSRSTSRTTLISRKGPSRCYNVVVHHR